MDEFSMHHERKGKVTVLTISGRVDSSTATAVDATLVELVPKDKKLIIDLQNVVFLSSAGVRAIVSALKSAKKSRGVVKLAAVPDHTADILQTVGILEIVDMYPSVDEALASFQA